MVIKKPITLPKTSLGPRHDHSLYNIEEAKITKVVKKT